MTKLLWDQVGQKTYETGVDHGVLYIPDALGDYENGYAWNGLTAVTESPSGAESNKQYADNIVYANLKSAEEFAATIEAFTYPDEFAQCDGSAVVNGVQIGQQTRKSFGFSWRSLKGNDLEQTDYGYKIHLVYGADAAPTERAHNTVNESPELATLSWEVTTTPTAVEGTNPVTGKPFKPTAKLTIDSTDVDAAALAALETILYGTVGVDPRLPSPTEVLALFDGTFTEVTTVAPTYDSGTDIVTIPAVAGVVYSVDGVEVPSGAFGPITADVFITAAPAAGYVFSAGSDDDWAIDFV